MKKTLLFLTLTAASLASVAQTASNRWNIGAGIGFTDFVNPINKQFLMVDKWRGNANLNIQRYLGKSFDGRLNIGFGEAFYPVALNQAFANQTVPATFDQTQKGRMRYENSSFFDGGLNLVYKLANGYIIKEDAFIQPYLFSGVGINSINKIGTQNGSNLGGAGSDQINPYIPVGFGLGFNLSDKFNAAAEYGYKVALGESYSYGSSAFRIGYNFGGGAAAAPAAGAASTEETAINANWCNNYNWKVGVGANFNSFEAVQRAQNFILEDYTTSLGINLTKYISRFFDVRAGLGFGNVFYPIQKGATQPHDGDNWSGTKGNTSYGSAQMIDFNIQPVLKFANGSWMKENAIFAPYVYAGPGVNYITSIGNWNAAPIAGNASQKTYGTDDVNFHISSGLGFNFRTSDRFSVQIEGGRNWKLDNSYSYNQAAIRGVYALGNCAGAAPSKPKASTEAPKVVDSDGDGIPDLTDECPYVPGKPEMFGCPDSDNDGIGDSRDKCPFEAGPASNNGCPEVAKVDEPVKTTEPTTTTETTKTSTGKTKNVVGNYEIFFTGCNTLSPGQVETLQQIATMLKSNPNYTVEIGGNTSKGGSKSCALQRAQKVAQLLRMKGVNVSNAKVTSYGDSRAKYNSGQDNRADVQIFSFE
jgi:OOP family OmpA-OmpF porin